LGIGAAVRLGLARLAPEACFLPHQQFYVLRGRAYARKGNYDDAIADYTAAIVAGHGMEVSGANLGPAASPGRWLAVFADVVHCVTLLQQ
jgi:hypothetical protein